MVTADVLFGFKSKLISTECLINELLQWQALLSSQLDYSLASLLVLPSPLGDEDGSWTSVIR